MIVFVLKYSELYCISLLFGGFPRDSLGIPCTINRISKDIPVWAGSRSVAVKGLMASLVCYSDWYNYKPICLYILCGQSPNELKYVLCNEKQKDILCL